MTQHGSFPGRPRGRRARQDNDVPEWQGYDATPEDQREFPDLSPIRPREASARDARLQGDNPPQPQLGQQAQPGGAQYGGAYQGGYGQPAAPGQYGEPGNRPGPGQHAAGQYGGGAKHGAPSYPGGAYGDQAQQGQEQARTGQPPWPAQQDPQHPASQQAAQQQAAQQQTVKYQATPFQPPQQPAPAQPERSAPKAAEDATPSWAEPDSVEAFSERWHRRGLDSQEDLQSDGRKRRRLLIALGTVIALAIAVTIYLVSGGPGAANLGFGNFVTNFLPGELQQVPDPCATVPTSMLNQYLPGTRKEAAPPLNTGANTECTWTLDSPPTYRVLQVQLQAYSPSGLASGNGSATFAAEDAYLEAENGFASPGPKSGQPKATVTDLSGMPGGSQTSAFQATQVFNRGGAVTDVTSVLVRYRNVIVTVVVDGLDQSGSGKHYGPVSMSDLTAAAQAVANEMASQIAK